MKLTILGTAGAYPGPGGACAGYLVESGDSRILLDCGTGVLANLQKHIPVYQLSHIIISHMHADHFFDLVPLRYLLAFGPRSHRVALHLPPGGAETLLSVVSFLRDPAFFTSFFDVSEYRPGATDISGLRFEFAPVPHYVPSYAMSINGDGRLTYSSDCGPSDVLASLAAGSALLLTEALLTYPAEHGPRGHLTMGEAAEIAARAGASRLLLSHVYHDRDYTAQLALARKTFPGPVEVAELNKSYTV
ncbi:MAG: MBL fold metallo-hydrolase [Chloroflexi bacterium]|nr:MBL fold metallo-hydrolase [Chloroflexota bacterium]